VSGLRVWVVDFKYEDYNLGLLLQFYFDYHVRFIRQREPEYALPWIDATYLLWLLNLLGWKGEQVMSNKIFRDLLTMPRGTLWSVPDSGEYCNDDARDVYGMLRQLRPAAQWFLGFCGGSLKEMKIEIDRDVAHHTLNHRARQFIDGTVHSGRGDLYFPWYIRRYSWPIECVRIIADNTMYLNHFLSTLHNRCPGQVGEWLLNRLRGMSDEEISRISQLAPDESYDSWLKSHWISTGPATELTAVDDWLQACETLGIEPDPADVGAQNAVWEVAPRPTPQPAIETSEEDTQMAGNPGEFRHSLDYRSVVAVDGRTFVLSPKQAEVISMLHQAFENGTPEVSNALVINEIFPNSKERKLKRLFRNNAAFGALIEIGAGRGLVRLKVSEKRGATD